MSVYHCPLCPLVFQYRTEVEWHLREEHRSRTDEDARLRSEIAAATAPLDSRRLEALRASSGRPSVTLMLATAPAGTMGVVDIARLRQSAERARRRLHTEPDRDSPVPVVEHRLSRVVSAAETVATDRGLAVMVNQHDLAIVTLPFAPRDRQVVDEGFATRDLEYSMRRYPRYRALLLGRHPRILEGRLRHLSEPPCGVSEYLDAATLLALRVQNTGTLPLVLVGDRRQIDEFLRRSHRAGDVVATASRTMLRRTNPVELATDAIERWLQIRQHKAVAELDDAERQHHVAFGVEAAWSALSSKTADRLWVEHDFAVSGRILPGVKSVQMTSDPAEPGVVDDLVDALISRAGRSGVPVDMLDPGVMRRAEPVAASIPLNSQAPAAQTAHCTGDTHLINAGHG